MSNLSKRALFWTPRALSILFIAFLSLFALDVFDGRHSFREMMLAFLIHQIPVFVLIISLILAWRWEWIGAVLFGAAGLFYIVWVLFIQTHMPPAMRPGVILMIAGPVLAISGLFLANWRKHDELLRVRPQRPADQRTARRATPEPHRRLPARRRAPGR
jgi:hypothetical protein